MTRSALVAALLVASSGCQLLYDKIGGDFVGEPEELLENVSPGARALIERAFAEIDPERLLDFHAHLIGAGNSSGIELHPSWLGSCSPLVRGRTGVYMSAAGIDSVESADEDYVARLLRLHRSVRPHGRSVLLAMDEHVTPEGTVDPERTPYYVPNELVVQLAREHPDVFVPAASVHPYRPDALEELDRCADLGVRFVKWIPNSMGIDPASPRLDAFYERMRARGMVLLTHTGRELTFESEQAQGNGNPLHLRRPLELGVRVVAFHCAADGVDIDLESPEREEVPSFDLVLRLLDDPRYEGLLFGEISAIAFPYQRGRPLATLLARADLHPRLVNGSDYPLVGINVLTQTGELCDAGYLSEDEAEQLDEIYGYNPHLFDFVLKRSLRHPETGARFAPGVFMIPEALRDAFDPDGGPR